MTLAEADCLRALPIASSLAYIIIPHIHRFFHHQQPSHFHSLQLDAHDEDSFCIPPYPPNFIYQSLVSLTLKTFSQTSIRFKRAPAVKHCHAYRIAISSWLTHRRALSSSPFYCVHDPLPHSLSSRQAIDATKALLPYKGGLG